MTNFDDVHWLSDFNACCSWRWKNDIINFQGQLDSLAPSIGYNQIRDKPAHVVNNSMSCINLIFCTDQNTISNHGAGCFNF